MLKLLIPAPLFTIAVLLFWGIQLWRDPDVPADYVSTFYQNQTQDWEGNGYIALQGLSAPFEQQDYYTHGKNKILAAFIRNQQLKEKLDISIPPAYPVPETKTEAAPVVPPGEEMIQPAIIKEENSFGLPCRYLWPDEENTDKKCLTGEQLRTNVGAYKILWERFNSLPDYKIFSVVPIGIETFISGKDLIQLSHWKAAEILEIAASGDAQKAFDEWQRFMALYRAMVSTSDSVIAKAIYMVMEKTHRHIYAKLLYHHPSLAAHIETIEQKFPAQGIGLFRGENLFSDDWAQVEETMLNSYAQNAEEHGWTALKSLMPTGDSRGRMYKCQESHTTYLRGRPASSFSAQEFASLCRKLFPDEPDFFQMMIVMPGNPVSNVIHTLLIGGSLKGGELVENMYIADLQWRMALAGSHIIKGKIGQNGIAAYIAQTDGFDSQLPLQWDGSKNRLFFKDMNGTERSFYIPAY